MMFNLCCGDWIRRYEAAGDFFHKGENYRFQSFCPECGADHTSITQDDRNGIYANELKLEKTLALDLSEEEFLKAMGN